MSKWLRALLCVVLVGPIALGSSQTLAISDEDKQLETTQSSIKESFTIPSEQDSNVVENTEVSEEKTTASIPQTNESQKKQDVKKAANALGPQATNLIEGVDIDADFALLLRTNSGIQNNGTAWSGWGKSQDQLTDVDMAAISTINVSGRNLSSLKGIEYAVNLTILNFQHNQLTDIDISNNILLTHLYFNYNQLTDIDISNNILLTQLECVSNQLTDLDISHNSELTALYCQNNQITALDASNNLNLTTLFCSNNGMDELNIDNLTKLVDLLAGVNQITNLNVSDCTKLQKLMVQYNNLSSLDASNLTDLKTLTVGDNQLTTLNVSNCAKLDVLQCLNNQLTDIDVSDCVNLTSFLIYNNDLTDLDVSHNLKLTQLLCSDNQLTSLDVSNNTDLKALYCDSNYLSDITSLNGLSQLTHFTATNQKIQVPVPTISNSNDALVDILKTTAHNGLSASNGDVSPVPTLSCNGDEIQLGGVTTASLSGKYISFSYDGAQLTEGSSSPVIKQFSGQIHFFSVSDLESELEPSKKKVNSGEDVEWTWTITNSTLKKAENIFANLNFPMGLSIDSSTVKKNGFTTSVNDLYGMNNLGALDTGETMIYTFKTTAVGNADEWLFLKGALDWEDDTPPSPYSNEAEGQVKILDDEQKDKPIESNDLELLSIPLSFRYGISTVSNTNQTLQLDAINYQTNTQVVTNGFYTRMRDDRSTNSGWKLTAQLSDFTDNSNTLMPNSAGTSLRMEDMTIESILDRDTSQEMIDPSPTGVPSMIVADETLVAGQAAKTLVSAQANEGVGTWQLRMPFDKVSLSLPANAGERSKHYTANLTWSLNDTP